MLLETAFMCSLTLSKPRAEWSPSDSKGPLVDSTTYDDTSFPTPAACSGETEGDWAESRARTVAQVKLAILQLITAEPGIDDVEVAEKLGEIPFEVSQHLRALAAEGLIAPAE